MNQRFDYCINCLHVSNVFSKDELEILMKGYSGTVAPTSQNGKLFKLLALNKSGPLTKGLISSKIEVPRDVQVIKSTECSSKLKVRKHDKFRKDWSHR